MTGLWALAALLDDKLIKYMYGEDEIHTGMGSTEDMVLMIVTETAYIALPVVWIWLVSGFTGSSISGVNSLFAYTAGKLDSAGQAGQSVNRQSSHCRQEKPRRNQPPNSRESGY